MSQPRGKSTRSRDSCSSDHMVFPKYHRPGPMGDRIIALPDRKFQQQQEEEEAHLERFPNNLTICLQRRRQVRHLV